MYDFKQLSPADFEELTRDLLQHHLKITLESFKTGRDQGIDLRYSVNRQHSIIIQCKRFVDTSVSKLVRELKNEEAPKVARLAPARYILVTSLPLNPTDKDKILNAMAPYILATSDIVGAEMLNNLLGLYPEIEGKHFKLWLSSTAVLQRVLHNAEIVQTDFDVDRVRRSIPLYVQNENYSRALKILEEQKFVIISGVPGIGKTTLADMLLYTHLDSSYEPFVIKSEIVEGRRAFNNARKQIFYFDDFLGETFLGNRFDFIGKKEDSAILDFMEIISNSKHSRLILTTREHILQHAFQISERFQRGKGTLSAHRCVLELANYGLLDRARILYNHIFFSDLPSSHKAKLLKDQFYMKILKHRNFNPRLIEWLSQYTNVKSLGVEEYTQEVERILDNPEQLWRIAFEQQISEASRSILLTLYTLGGVSSLIRLKNSWGIIHSARSSKYNWKTAAEDWRRSLHDLEGGFIHLSARYSRGGPATDASFVNPSVKDFIDATLASDVDHFDDLLDSSRLFHQIVNLWSLVTSEKGKPLGARLKASPGKLLEVVHKLLAEPHRLKTVTERSTVSYVAHDAFPEIRLKTIVSIADYLRNATALEYVIEYAEVVVNWWEREWADFDEATAILRLLDHAKWAPLRNNDLHEKLKAKLLEGLQYDVDSKTLATIAAYAEGEGARWSSDDERSLQDSFDGFLEDKFADELNDCESPTDVENLSTSLNLVSSRFSTTHYDYASELSKREDELTPPEREEDNDREPRGWGIGNSGLSSERAQELEVDRLFDGLK